MSSLVDPPQPLAQNAVTRYVRIDGKKIAYRRFGKRDADPREPGKDDLISLMFAHTETSKALGEEWIKRRPDRRVKGETVTPALGEPGMHAQLTAIANWAGNKDNFARLKDIKAPVLITNGHKDIMLPTVNSFIMQQEISYAFLHIYPDSAHGHPFQFPKQYAELVKDFLDMGSRPSAKL